MTTTPETLDAVEQELANRLGMLARSFVADLKAQGRLVGPRGAETLERLRTQIEARRDLPESYRVAVETIIEDCGYPSEVAVSVCTALRRKGLLSDTSGPRPQQEVTAAEPLAATRGAVVVPRTRRPADSAPQPMMQRVDGPAQVRPGAARPPQAEDGPAARWDAARARAVTVATGLRARHAGRLEVMEIAADHERVTVAIRALALSDWEYWLEAIGAPLNAPTRTAGYAQVAAGKIDGVDVHLTAHDVPRLLQAASDAAGEPFYLWGRIYDLSRGLVDQGGRTWVYLGQRQAEGGMPLMALRGGDGKLYPLASIVMAGGSMTPVDLPPVPAEKPRESAGGER
ncbi:BN159_2729 family protein [Streptomyces cylindrosporus]|uniref:BN159_2729 family protein n=1 Tax=Streptomyces cylindrosporus TaxID=2927583 RepID=A0ABS9YNY8_9ACTN|nr:BN159_2729 family protein [Streptomyces cylindrosporus]MCI3277561.1 BN159_2729 family protein [Streptomyces cylindrosporus]